VGVVDAVRDKSELFDYGFSHRGSVFSGDSSRFHQKHVAPILYFRRDFMKI
jgi:hypothetical protein